MKAWAVSTVFTPASLQAPRRFRRPAVKFSMVGMRAKACRPKKVTTAPALDGSSTPTCSPLAVMPAIFRPRAKLPRIRSV